MALLLSVFEIARTVYVGLVRDSRSDTVSAFKQSRLYIVTKAIRTGV